MLQAQARLWEGLSAVSERLDVLHAALRETVVRRYRELDGAAVEAGRYGDADYLPADEEPNYQGQWQQNRCAFNPEASLPAYALTCACGCQIHHKTRLFCELCLFCRVRMSASRAELCMKGDQASEARSTLCYCREAAFAAAMEFSKGTHIAEAAKSLYLAEIVMDEDAGSAKKPNTQSSGDADSCRCQLLTVLGEIVLDESMP